MALAFSPTSGITNPTSNAGWSKSDGVAPFRYRVVK